MRLIKPGRRTPPRPRGCGPSANPILSGGLEAFECGVLGSHPAGSLALRPLVRSPRENERRNPRGIQEVSGKSVSPKSVSTTRRFSRRQACRRVYGQRPLFPRSLEFRQSARACGKADRTRPPPGSRAALAQSGFTRTYRVACEIRRASHDGRAPAAAHRWRRG